MYRKQWWPVKNKRSWDPLGALGAFFNEGLCTSWLDESRVCIVKVIFANVPTEVQTMNPQCWDQTGKETTDVREGDESSTDSSWHSAATEQQVACSHVPVEGRHWQDEDFYCGFAVCKNTPCQLGSQAWRVDRVINESPKGWLIHVEHWFVSTII